MTHETNRIRALAAHTEAVIINMFGSTAQQYVPDPQWHLAYLRYQEGFAAAADKGAFNAQAASRLEAEANHE